MTKAKKTKPRTALTKSGKRVELDTLLEVEGGWLSYAVHGNGFAVAVFIPSN